MAGSVTCACGKDYKWKPEYAGKRAKCKCGGVVAFPADDPADAGPPPLPDLPEGFEDSYAAAHDAPPPPPPLAPGRAAGATATTAPTKGGFRDSTATAGGGFQWNWRAALNILIGLGIAGFGVFEFVSISQTEAAGDEVVFGRRNRWLRTVYSLGGKWAVLGFFVIVGLCFIGGAVLTMMGKLGNSSNKDD